MNRQNIKKDESKKRIPLWPRTPHCVGAAIGGMMLIASSSWATDIQPGVDLWVTPAGASYDMTPIPAGFFTSMGGEPSLPYTAGIRFQGVPLQTNPPNVIFPADTIVMRPVPAALPACGSSDTVPIEIVALSLTAVSPITVEYPSGNSELWDVRVCLPPGPQPQGQMTIRHECVDGGTYDATLPVLPQFTFTRLMDGAQQTLIPPDPIVLQSQGAWSHQDPFGNLLTTINPTVVVDTDCDGVPETSGFNSTPAPDGFFPGLEIDPAFACDCTTPGTYRKPMTPEQQRWAAHGVFIANADKPQQVGACCTPAGCVMTSQLLCQGQGLYLGDGIQCTPDPCTTNARCGDGLCDPTAGEDSCTCVLDCGASPATESNCNNGIDDDCDNLVDCADPDCIGDPGCGPPIPAQQPWGFVAAAVAVLIGGVLILRRRCSSLA